ncbi:hypothetical protein FQN54_000521 [Arachnomyces sp. PD_36]|nr:hypothetical protein FQN54_000521 [Arachnomyces sp. PD_36]
MESHKEAVDIISANVRGFYERKEPFRIYHGATNSTRKSPYRKDRIIDTRSLSNVLEVNRERKTALVEPNVPMDRLVEVTTEYGLVPPVVMELPGITVGGGFAGTAGESSSFKYGIFDCTINSIEIVLANGDVVNASSTERPDLLAGAAGSCGTFGVITLLEIQLIDAAKYVELTYHPLPSIPSAIQKCKQETQNPSIDYLDGIIFSKTSSVIMTGRLTNTCPPGTSPQRFTRAHDPWFYLHAKDCLSKSTNPETPYKEAIPLADYLFRYDRGAFWGGAHAFKYFLTPFNRITRWLLNPFMHTRTIYHAFHESNLSNRTIVQDLGIPFSKVEEFITFIDSTFNFYPLWLCPIRPTQPTPRGTFAMTNAYPTPSEYLLNVGVWGMGPSNRAHFISLNRSIERKVHELSGLKCLYAHAYYTEDEFWDVYDRKAYEALREKYHAGTLPSVFEKVRVDFQATTGEGGGGRGTLGGWLRGVFWGIWPFSGLYGVYRVVVGGDYLMRRGVKDE